MARVYITCCSRCGKQAPHLIAAAAGKQDDWIAKADGELLHVCPDGVMGRAEEFDANDQDSLPKLNSAFSQPCPLCDNPLAFPKKYVIPTVCHTCGTRRVSDDEYMTTPNVGGQITTTAMSRRLLFMGYVHAKILDHAQKNPILPQFGKLFTWCLNGAGVVYSVTGDTNFIRAKDSLRKSLGCGGSDPRMFQKLTALMMEELRAG